MRLAQNRVSPRRAAGPTRFLARRSPPAIRRAESNVVAQGPTLSYARGRTIRSAHPLPRDSDEDENSKKLRDRRDHEQGGRTWRAAAELIPRFAYKPQDQTAVEEREACDYCLRWVTALRAWETLTIEWQHPQCNADNYVNEPPDHSQMRVLGNENIWDGTMERLEDEHDASGKEREHQIRQTDLNEEAGFEWHL